MRRRNAIASAVSSVCLFIAVAVPASAVTIYAEVNVTDKDLPDVNPGDGVCSASWIPMPNVASCTLRAAVMELNAYVSKNPYQDIFRVVHLPPGVYTLSLAGRGENAAQTGDLDILRSMTIAGTDPEHRAVINAHGIDRVFDVRAPTFVVEFYNLEITGGAADKSTGDGQGGGIRVGFGAAGLIQNVRLWANRAGVGGAIYNDGGRDADDQSAARYLRIQSSELALNSLAEQGSNNPRGAAIFSRGKLQLYKSSIFLNSGDGGQRDPAIWAEPWNAALLQPELSIELSTIGDNVGTAVHTQDVPLSLVRSTVVDNLGIGLRFAANWPAALNITRSIVAGNETECMLSIQAQTTTSWNLYRGGGCPSSPNDHSLFGVDPQLYDRADNGGRTETYLPMPGSLVIDRYGCTASIDQRGFGAPADGNGDGVVTCDIGAVEVQPDEKNWPR